jgi:hypothetical protein
MNIGMNIFGGMAWPVGLRSGMSQNGIIVLFGVAFPGMLVVGDITLNLDDNA